MTCDQKIHQSTVRVLYGDTDAGGVVYNANYLRYFEYGRTEFMRERVCSYRHIEQLGFILPVTECWSRFKAPARYDDLLTVCTEVSQLNRLKCTFSYRILREEPDTPKPRLLVKGYTVHVAVTRDGRLTRLPEEIIEKLALFARSCDLG
ncbi:MAG: acyl-CoA thioesterase [Desulfopila sp.]